MRITRDQALMIAKQAKEEAGYDIQHFSGYFTIWEDERDSENNYAVAINKEKEDKEHDYFAIYVSSPGDENYWEYTDDDSVEGLTDELMRIAINIEIAEMRRQGFIVTQI